MPKQATKAADNWDGKCPCKPEDCKDCPYSGTGCEIDPKTHKNQTDNGHK